MKKLTLSLLASLFVVATLLSGCASDGDDGDHISQGQAK